VKISRPLQGSICGVLSGLLIAAGWFLWLYGSRRRETIFMSHDEVWKMMRSDLVIAASIFIVVSILVGVGVALLPKYETRHTGDV
jgi:hypothetical protein